jgi:hypothetical protein
MQILACHVRRFSAAASAFTLCLAGFSGAAENEISIHINLYGRGDTYCLGSELISFGVTHQSRWEPLAFCFFQERNAAGEWVDCVEVDEDGLLVAPFWTGYLRAHWKDGRLFHSTTSGSVPEEDLAPEGRQGTFRLFCGLIESDIAPTDLPATPKQRWQAALTQLRSRSFADLIQSSRHLTTKAFLVKHCEEQGDSEK